MSYFAEIDDNNIVKRVIAASEENINKELWGSPDNWIQTSYNTRGGVHYAPNSHTPDGGVALRKNYAGKGDTYDASKDAFIAPQPYPSWTLNEDTCQWEPPTAYSDDDKMCRWDEDNLKWKEIE